MSTHKQRTRRNTRVAQVAALLLAAGAAALGFARIPQGEGATLPPPPQPPAQGQEGAATTADFDSALRVMNDLVDKTKFRPAPPPGKLDKDAVAIKDPDPPAPVPPPPPPPSDWRYLGSIIGPSTAHAFVVSSDGQQHLIAQGQEVGGITLVSVSPSKLVVRNATGEHDVALEARPPNQAPDNRSATSFEPPDFSKAATPDQRAQMEQEWAQRKAAAEKGNTPRPQPARPPTRPNPPAPGKPAIDPKSGEKLSRNNTQ